MTWAKTVSFRSPPLNLQLHLAMEVNMRVMQCHDQSTSHPHLKEQYREYQSILQ